MDFVALDVETANPFMGSICQIGAVKFKDGAEIDSFAQLIDPDDYFDPENIDIHGITPQSVAGMPKFSDVLPRLSEFVGNSVVIHHTHFDRVSIHQACDLTGAAPAPFRWLDSAKMARRCWPDVAQRGFGLARLAERLGISFRHHDALEDARATALVAVAILRESGMTLDDWGIRAGQSIIDTSRNAFRREGGEDGPLAGEVLVFTGQLQLPRRDAADRAQALGASVDDLLTKRTSILVVGDQDLSKLAGHSKSSKHRKAESLIAQGHCIRIVAERDFMAF